MKTLPKISSDFSAWYHEVIHQAELVDEGPTRGTMVIRPYGYAIWENIQKILDEKIKATGAQNAYFPLLIPESFLSKEKKHIEGFSPELAVVTHAGGKKLAEPLVVRPTSETMVYHMFSRWIKSYRDLPLKINQWANVVRWEKRTRPFLRTSEFLWQEGHSAHATKQEALQTAKQMLAIYTELAQEYLAIPVVTGEKSATERFAGADHTFTFEGMMQDGKALQMGTSHVLSQTFSNSFGVQYQDADGTMKSPFCTSWGVTTRLIGALIMVHGDDNGLIIPPKVAPYQVVIVPIYRKDEEKEQVLTAAHHIKQQLADQHIRVLLDDDEQHSPGAKFFRWELKGVPVRIEIGPRDVAAGKAVVVNRAVTDKAEKKQLIEQSACVDTVQTLFSQIHTLLYERAKAYRKKHWYYHESLANFGPLLEKNNGFYQTGWCGTQACEEKLKAFKGSIRCVLPEQQQAQCFACDEKSLADVVVAKAY